MDMVSNSLLINSNILNRTKSVLFLGIVIMTAFFSNQITAQKSITMEDMWINYSYFPKYVPGFNFMNDGQHFTRLENNQILRYDLVSGRQVDVVLNGDNLSSDDFGGKIDSYEFSADESKIIIYSETDHIYRRSTMQKVHIYDRRSQDLISVFFEDKVIAPLLSPAGSKLSYVWKNNIYIYNLEDGITLPVTFDGEKNKIINGVADWVYEEEFSFYKAMWWSPDGSKLAYLRFDETEIPVFQMTKYNGDLYPEYIQFKYPKVGEKNSDVSVHYYDIAQEKAHDVLSTDDQTQYIPRLTWTPNSEQLIATTLNRHQNHLQLVMTHISKEKKSILIDEKNKYYIDIHDNLTFVDDEQFIWTSEKSGYNHIYLYKTDGKEIRPLTSGAYDVTELYGYDKSRKEVLYQAADKNALERSINKVDLKGRKRKVIQDKSGTNNASFSSTFDYYVWNHSSANKPSRYVVMDHNGKELRLLEDNAELAQKMTDYNFQPVEFMTFDNGEGVDLYGFMIKPPHMEAGKKYPVLMYVYGGPGSQTVRDTWHTLYGAWFQSLVQQGYIVVSVDNRGTGARGEQFKKMTYLELGKYELEDQIAVAKHLGSLDYIDSERIGIFGWSYGGYMTSNCMFKAPDVFKLGIAVAPVTNWKWYDTVYTERFMRTTEENESGYEDNSPINFVEGLQGHFLLVHGMADDNVHFQNTAELTKQLINHRKQFDTHIYPNKAHGISGRNAKFHLFTKMTNFVTNNL